MADNFFAQQKQLAIKAIRRCIEQSATSVKQNADPRPLIRHRPMLALGSAAAAGLLAGWMLIPGFRKGKKPTGKKTRTTVGRVGRLAFRELGPMLRTVAATAVGAAFKAGYAGSHPDGEADEYDHIPQHRIQI